LIWISAPARGRQHHKVNSLEERMAITAADIMTSPAITISPATSMAEIALLLSTRNISALPVCAPDGALLGIVSEQDVLRPFRESARQKRDWWLTLLAEGEQLSQEFLDYIRQDTRSASEIMARNVAAASETATVPELAELMVSRGVRRLPILRGGRVVGIVSRADMVRAIAREPAMLI
jgi:CBS domain-containing protein